MTRPRLTQAQRTKVKSLMEDEGQTRAAAVAWVRAFEPAQAAEAKLAAIAKTRRPTAAETAEAHAAYAAAAEQSPAAKRLASAAIADETIDPDELERAAASRKLFKQRALDLQRAFDLLLLAWEDLDGDALGGTYPFGKSFDEVGHDVARWVREMGAP